jgi:hypothetical protein
MQLSKPFTFDHLAILKNSTGGRHVNIGSTYELIFLSSLPRRPPILPSLSLVFSPQG